MYRLLPEEDDREEGLGAGREFRRLLFGISIAAAAIVLVALFLLLKFGAV